jgi:hypothetical protein
LASAPLSSPRCVTLAQVCRAVSGVLVWVFVAGCEPAASRQPDAATSVVAGAVSAFPGEPEGAQPCEATGSAVQVRRSVLESIDRKPAAAKAVLARYAKNRFEHPGRLAYELAAWAQARPTAPYLAHLKTQGADPERAAVQCALLQLSMLAARAETAGPAAAWFGAWASLQKPRTLSKTEIEVAVAVYEELLNADSPLKLSLVHGVLRIDVNAGAIVKAHIGIYNGDDLIAFVREMAAKYPEASWVGEIARDVPSLATVGDLKDAAMRAKLALLMVELGGVSKKEANARLNKAP